MSDLAAVLDEAWGLLARGGLVTVCTVSGGAPRARTVVLRETDRAQGRVGFYTDARSTKVREITENPQVALLIWREPAQVQLRLTGRATVETGLTDLWQTIPEDRREPYSHQPAPGTPIPAADAWEEQPAPEHFARVTVTLDTIEHVSLANSGHTRALFSSRDRWGGQWMSP
ncbi:pyridoxamine 5'-phosphate oxidase family protein [Lutimaribacter marinistellae]|uniref:Pyridoxamine 5'-phosphate oxidase family protein n=1 Tax=Lutimaribacter marinistellae TaxID=1820329 RepID=A0ABV7TN20_9RHOB